jgi:hypothetical protein
MKTFWNFLKKEDIPRRVSLTFAGAVAFTTMAVLLAHIDKGEYTEHLWFDCVLIFGVSKTIAFVVFIALLVNVAWRWMVVRIRRPAS